MSYTITAGNTGAVRLKNLTLQVPSWANVTDCTPSLPGPWIIAPYKTLVCHAQYTFSQDFYEAGPLSFVSSAKPAELAAAVQSAPAVIAPTYTASLTAHKGSCTFPTART